MKKVSLSMNINDISNLRNTLEHTLDIDFEKLSHLYSKSYLDACLYIIYELYDICVLYDKFNQLETAFYLKNNIKRG